MTRIHIRNASVVTLGTTNKVLPGSDVLIEDDRIIAVGKVETHQLDNVDKTIDAHGMLLMPGFINSHMHFYSSFARGLSTVAPSHNFREILSNLWWRLDKKLTLADCYMSALVACIEAIKRGTTTLIDHHASPGCVRSSLNEVARAMVETGVRGSTCYELSDRDGAEIARLGIEENREFIRITNKDQDSLVKGMFGLHASFTIEQPTLESAVEAMRGEDVGFHIHCAEDLADQQITQNRYKKTVVERLYSTGVLGNKTICAHGVHLSDHELDLLAKTNSILVHNPQSNMNNAVGMLNIAHAMEKGVLVGLGTDAMTVNMLEELRSAVWAQKMAQQDPQAGFIECSQALIQNNSVIASRYWNKIGEITPGYKADLILVDYCAPTPMVTENFLGHLVFGLNQGRVQMTMVNGKILMENGDLLFLDEEKIMSDARQLSGRLWARF